MTLSPRLLKEFDKLIGEMDPTDKEQFKRELESTRNPDGTRTTRSSNALLDRIIRQRPYEEQRAIKGRLVSLSRSEKEETARIAAETAANARAAAEAQTRAAEAARVAAETARAAAEAEAREAEIVGTAANTLTTLRHGNDQSSIATYILSRLQQPQGGRSQRKKRAKRKRTKRTLKR